MKFGGSHLEYILFNAPSADSSHRNRRSWILDLMNWVHPRAFLADLSFGEDQDPALERLKTLLKTLERSENFRKAVTENFRLFLLQSDPVELFATTGVPDQSGFLGEMSKRLLYRILPQPPGEHDLALAMMETFAGRSPARWLQQMDLKTFQQIVDLIACEELDSHFQHSIEDAVLILSIQIRSAGISPALRERMSKKSLRDNPFFSLGDQIRAMVEWKDPVLRERQADLVLKLIQECTEGLENVHAHLNEYGVSVEIVYQLERLRLQLHRMKTLVLLLVDKDRDRLAHILRLVTKLAEDLARVRSLRALLAVNLSLLAKKISERTAQTGEHYITRNRQELKDFIYRAMGGGFVMGFTTVIKFAILALPLAPFLTGTFASVNYATSFVVIQLLGFTVATKQPAMTATTLAARMQNLTEPKAFNDLIEELIHLVRSQVMAIFGNLIAVAPTVAVIDLLIFQMVGHHMIDDTHAREVLHSTTLFGPVIVYSIVTGIFLFASSQVAGWFDNFWVLHKMGPALRFNRKIQFVFGERAAARISLFFSKSVGAMAGNISLGVFLGLFPVIFRFFGVPLDIRHVTLSTGSVTAAALQLGPDIFLTPDFLLAVAGLLAIASGNVVTAFIFSMFVALRAREVQAPERSKIYRSFWSRVFQNPLRLFWI